MSSTVPVRDIRDRFAVVGSDGKVLFWAEYTQAQDLLKKGEVEAIRSHGGKGRIRCLSVVAKASRTPQRPTPIRQHGTMGDSHTQIRECHCGQCRDNGSPIPEHQYRSTNPPGVWTIDSLPHWGKGDWKTRAIFRRPLLEAIYGRERVEKCLNPSSAPPTPSRSKAA